MSAQMKNQGIRAARREAKRVLELPVATALTPSRVRDTFSNGEVGGFSLAVGYFS